MGYSCGEGANGGNQEEAYAAANNDHEEAYSADDDDHEEAYSADDENRVAHRLGAKFQARVSERHPSQGGEISLL